MPPIILASRSPRRSDLLEQAGYEFIVEPAASGAECGVCSGETPREFVARLAYQKTADVAKRLGRGLILGCDTIAEHQGRIFGKPENEKQAKDTLNSLSGQEHRVHTGICLWDYPSGKPDIRIDTTHLRMDKLSETQLVEYLDSGEWEGKAGAFGFQDRLGWVHIVQGSESNVVGLPLELLQSMIDDYRKNRAER